MPVGMWFVADISYADALVNSDAAFIAGSRGANGALSPVGASH
jgi:hypothetical protein